MPEDNSASKEHTATPNMGPRSSKNQTTHAASNQSARLCGSTNLVKVKIAPGHTSLVALNQVAWTLIKVFLAGDKSSAKTGMVEYRRRKHGKSLPKARSGPPQMKLGPEWDLTPRFKIAAHVSCHKLVLHLGLM